MPFRPQTRSAWWLGACAILCTAAWAAEPSVSVPSTADIAGQVHIRGTHWPAYSSATVRFTPEALSPIDMVVPVAANGSFVLRFAPPIPGGCEVTVCDSHGKRGAQERFGPFPVRRGE